MNLFCLPYLFLKLNSKIEVIFNRVEREHKKIHLMPESHEEQDDYEKFDEGFKFGERKGIERMPSDPHQGNVSITFNSLHVTVIFLCSPFFRLVLFIFSEMHKALFTHNVCICVFKDRLHSNKW